MRCVTQMEETKNAQTISVGKPQEGSHLGDYM
jgi:hypothetical protein